MGLTPLDGFIMGTRTGAIDPSAVTFLMQKEGLTPAETDTIMNKKSGFLGISGVSSDMRDVEEAAAAGNERAQLALDIFYYEVPKIIASYLVFQRLDEGRAVVVTGEGDDRVDRFAVAAGKQRREVSPFGLFFFRAECHQVGEHAGDGCAEAVGDERDFLVIAEFVGRESLHELHEGKRLVGTVSALPFPQ